jgi:inhibitor of KinA
MAIVYEKALFRPVGDRGLLAEYGDGIDTGINRKVRAVTLALDQERRPGIVEVIPAYRSLMVVYDPIRISVGELERLLLSLERSLEEIDIPPPRTVEIPVCYGGTFGPDIEFVADHGGLSVDETIRMHSGTTYQVYMVGFTPGFPFLGGLPRQLHAPRLDTPRTWVPAGSVGIANDQTGIYTVPGPAGWRLIGQTPLKLFDPSKEEPFLYSAGDLIKFVPISEDEYRSFGGRSSP